MKILKSIITILFIIALTGCGSSTKESTKTNSNSSNEDKEIVVGAAGGIYERVIRDQIGSKFKEKYGINVKFVQGVSSEILSKLEIQKSTPQIDLAVMVPTEVQRAFQKDLIEKVTEDAIPNMKHLDERFVTQDKIGVPVLGVITAPGYNTKTFETKHLPPIVSWNDLARSEYQGRTAFSDIGNDLAFMTLYNLIKANGGDLTNADPGFQKAKDLAAYSTTFYNNSTQISPALQQGNADVTVLQSPSIAQLAVESGTPLKMVIPKEGAPIWAFTATMVKNAPHKKAAEEFLNFLISEESQKVVADNFFYPVLQGSKIPEKYEPYIGIKESDKLYKPDFTKLAEVRSAFMERWTKEITPELGKKIQK